MEECGNLFEGTSNTVRKKRSHPFRRPRLDSEALHEGCGISSMSSTPPWDDLIKGCSDENNGVGDSSSRKEINLNQCVSRFPAGTGEETERPSKRSRKEDVRLDVLNANNDFRDGSSVLNHKRSSEGVLAPANWKCPSRGKEYSDSQSSALAVPSELGQDGTGNETKVKKVTLKVGGVTHTIDPNSASKSSRASEASVQRPKLTLKVNSQVDRSLRDKRGGLQGIPWKDFTGGGLTLGNEGSSMGRMSGKRQSGKQGNKLDPVRKSRRAPKKRVMDGEFDDDDEIRYLEKVKNSKFTSGFKDDDDDDESGRKHRRLSKVSGMYGETMESKVSSKFVKEGKRKTPFGDTDYEEEEDPISDGEVDGKTMKKVRKEAIDSATEPKRETTLMTRQKALQSCKDPSASGGLIEFPNGLSPAPPRKKKERLTDVEQQVKKSEAAQRRRMQNEKAERETQAEAIRKILGQDSNKQKREKRKKKRQEELAQERAADALARASNSIRLVMGPNGTTVTFPNAMGLPNIFNSKTNSYPPPRDKCVGPSCSNPYKYRDSKTKLPLCSLQCYKQVQGNNMQSGEAPIGDIPAH